MSDYKPKNPIVMPSVDEMLADSLQVLRAEILRFKTKVAQGRPLDQAEAKTVQGYIRSLVELSKEDRERLKGTDLSQLTEEELVALLGAKAPKALQGKVE